MKAIVLFVLVNYLACGHCDDVKAPLEELRLSNGQERGEWGPTDLCKANSFVTSFEVKYSPQGHVDNTGLNAVRLFCQDKNGLVTSTLSSREGKYGEWEGIRSCKTGTYTSGMRGDVMPDQGTFGDDEAMVNLEMKCSDGTILNGRFSVGKDDQERAGMDVAREFTAIEGREVEAIHIKITENDKLGVLSTWAECSTGKRICGLSTEVESESTFTDDAGLCNIIMYCCAL